MALKRQHDQLSMFSMASMTDVIFLLLIFFMVTSTFVFPSALEINLPQSSQTTTLKPSTRLYIDENQQLLVSQSDSVSVEEPRPLPYEQLEGFLLAVKNGSDADHQFVALHADENVPYGKIVEVLDKGSKVGLKIVLATKPSGSAGTATQPQPEQEAQPAPAAQPAEQQPMATTNTQQP